MEQSKEEGMAQQLLALIPEEHKTQALSIIDKEEKKTGAKVAVYERVQNLQKHLIYLDKMMKSDLHDSLLILEKKASEKVNEAVERRITHILHSIEESKDWTEARTELTQMAEKLKDLQQIIQENLTKPDADLMQIGLEVGLQIERNLAAIQALESKIYRLRMQNAEWEGSLDTKVSTLFDNLNLEGVSSTTADLIRVKADGIHQHIQKMLHQLAREVIIQPLPSQKKALVVLPGLQLGISVTSPIQFTNQFSVTTLNGVGAIISGGLGVEQRPVKSTFKLKLKDGDYAIQTECLADAPYPHHHATLYPHRDQIVFLVAGDQSGKKVAWYNTINNQWKELPNMVHTRSQSPAVVFAGGNMYVTGSPSNNTTINYLKLEEKTLSFNGQDMVTMIENGGWKSAETNLDSAPNFARRLGPPESRKVLMISHYYWYNFDFSQNFYYSGWGRAQAMFVNPQDMSMRNVLTQESEKEEAEDLYVTYPTDNAKVFKFACSPCGYFPFSLHFLQS